MKVVNRGFSITEIDVPGVMAIDVMGVEGEETITLVTGPAGQNLSFSPEGWRALSAAVTAVNERLDGKPASADERSVIVDNDGDRWSPIPGTDKYSYADMKRTRDQIKDTYGIREE